MEYNKEKNYPLDKQPVDAYDDGDIPQVDLPQNLSPDSVPVKAFPEEMPVQTIPDEVPRKDGPGGDGSETCEL